MANGPQAGVKELVRSTVERPQGAPAPATPSERIALRISEIFQKTKEEKPLEALTQEVVQPLDFNTDTEVNRRVQGLRDPQRKTRAKEAADLAVVVMEDRFGSLTTQQQDNAVNKITRDALDQRAPFAANTTAAERRTIIRARLRRPEFRQKVREILVEQLNPDAPLEDQIVRATEQALNQVQTQLDEALTAQNPHTRHIDRQTAEQNLDNFVESPGGAGNTRGDEMRQLQATEAQDRQIAESMGKNLDLMVRTGKMTEAERQQLLLDVEQKALSGQPLDPNNQEPQYWEYIQAQRRIAGLDGLRQTKTALEQRLREIQTIEQLTQRRDNAGEEHIRVMIRQEEKTTRALERALSKAMNSVIDEELQAKDEARAKVLEEAIANEKDEDSKAILQGSKKRWDKPTKMRGDGKDRRAVSEINVENVRKDVSTMLTDPNGPDAIAEQLLLDKWFLVPGNAANTPAHQAEGVRIDAYLKSEHYKTQIQPKLVGGLLERHLRSGGKMYSQEVAVLKDTEWGRGAVMRAIEENKKLNEEIEKLYGEGALKLGLGEFWARMDKGTFLKWLVILFGGVAVAAMFAGGAGTSLPAIAGGGAALLGKGLGR